MSRRLSTEAITIIVPEVPQGTASDVFGHKKLLLYTALLMLGEMLVWAFASKTNTTAFFWVLALNRALSGLGEASVSGPDEAHAYDSLEAPGLGIITASFSQ